MQATLVYTVAYASAVALLLCWRLSQFLTTKVRERILSTFSKWVVYTVLFPRLNESSDVTVLSAVLIVLFLAGNVIASVLALHDRDELSSRLARLSSINMVFLYLGGRTNIIVDKGFRLSHTEYWLLHRWLGRTAVAQGLIHGTIEVVHSQATPAAIKLSLLAISGLMALISIIFVRRRIYELFLQTHLFFSIAMLILIWLHVHQLNAYLLSCSTAAASLLFVQKILWIMFVVRRNYLSDSIPRMSVTRFPGSGMHNTVIQVRLDIKKPWTVKPGQYIYLILPKLRSLGLGVLESHPFMIAWVVENEQARSNTIVLLVQVRRGFTQKLQFANPLSSAIIDGPYGGNELDMMAKYDKILLMSSGIGIASHLNTARYLLLAHDKQTARVRRLTILWLLETQDDFEWAQEFLCKLHDMDHRKILNIYLYYPSAIEKSSEGLQSSLEAPRERILPTSGAVDISWVLKEEWKAEAGNMLVLACGTPQFELCARRAVRRSPHNIEFRASIFQPYEAQSAAACKR